MLKLKTSLIIVIFGLGLLPCAFAEKETELYIPIDQSPGLSNNYTAKGRIESIDPGTQSLTMSDNSGSYTVKITRRTKIYLDNSQKNLSNTYGTFADCRKNRLVEVRFEEDSRGRPAEWIKILVER